MKVAIIHPWFLVLGGGEKVVEALAASFPNADMFALLGRPDRIPDTLQGRRIHYSFLNHVPGIRKLHRELMFLYPMAIESLDLSSYDLVISSAGPATFGVNVRQDALHICYCHSPGRSWWDQYAERQTSLSPIGKATFTAFSTYIRMWEFSAAQRVDKFAANSSYIAQRIRKYLRRDACVIYPPVNTGMGYLASRHQDYYLSVSRLEPRKRLDLVIDACNRLDRRLIIVGTGAEESRLKAIAGPKTEFAGRVSDSELPQLLAHCRAFLFAADEDFGIVPVEAQAFGRPVIAYGHGGSLETVRVGDPRGSSDTGVFFSEQTVDSVVEAIQRFEDREEQFLPKQIQQHARRFDTSVFMERMNAFIEGAMNDRSRT